MLANALPTVIEASAADTNGNGTIEMADLILLNKYLLGKDVKLSVYKAQ